jgi:hypothetical protein
VRNALYGLAGAVVVLVAIASWQARTSAGPVSFDPTPMPFAATDRTVSAGGAPLSVRCRPGEQAVVRQKLVSGTAATVVECMPPAGAAWASPAASPPPDLVGVRQPRVVRAGYEFPVAPRREVRRAAAPRRNWGRTALVIGGSAGAGAGVGGLAGGRKGALIGAAIGGGAATLFEALKR